MTASELSTAPYKILSIAGKRFYVSQQDPLLASQSKDPVYAAFIDEQPHSAYAAESDIQVRIEEGQLNNQTEHRPIFTTDNGWSLSNTDHGYLLSACNPSGKNQYSWNACCDETFTDIQITLSAGGLQLWRDSGSSIPALQYPLDQLLLFHHLASRDGLLIHTAGMNINQQGWLFSGPSGAGKSTISEMLLHKAGVHVINDDRMIVRNIKDKGWQAYGTPWPGDLRIAENTSIPLSALCFLARGAEMQLRELDPVAALRRLFPVTSIPWYLEDLMTQSLNLCEQLVNDIPTYELSFRPGGPVLDVLDYDKAA